MTNLSSAPILSKEEADEEKSIITYLDSSCCCNSISDHVSDNMQRSIRRNESIYADAESSYAYKVHNAFRIIKQTCMQVYPGDILVNLRRIDTLKKSIKRAIACELASVMAFVNLAVITAHAEGDVAGAVTGTWNTAKGQIKSVVDNVIFPVIDVILAILLFVKIGLAYMEYRKHGQLEWTPIAIIFACLIFTITAPLYIWSVVNI